MARIGVWEGPEPTFKTTHLSCEIWEAGDRRSRDRKGAKIELVQGQIKIDYLMSDRTSVYIPSR
jgi:hypothetical protein